MPYETHPDSLPRPGEIQLKVWVAAEAERTGLGERAIFQRIYRGKYPQLRLRRVNARVIFVEPETVEAAR